MKRHTLADALGDPIESGVFYVAVDAFAADRHLFATAGKLYPGDAPIVAARPAQFVPISAKGEIPRLQQERIARVKGRHERRREQLAAEHEREHAQERAQAQEARRHRLPPLV